jgi:hypothetical protein
VKLLQVAFTSSESCIVCFRPDVLMVILIFLTMLLPWGRLRSRDGAVCPTKFHHLRRPEDLAVHAPQQARTADAALLAGGLVWAALPAFASPPLLFICPTELTDAYFETASGFPPATVLIC